MAPTETNACYCDKGNASGEELHDLFCNGEEGVIFLEEREERREGGGMGERKGKKGKREEVKEEGGSKGGGRERGRLTSAGKAGRHAGDTRAGTLH